MSGYGSAPGGFWHPTITGEAYRLIGVRGRRNVEYNSDAFKKLHYVISRFVTTGPASYAWERIPFSFVVDWFVDLSSIVSALDNALTGFTQSFEDGWVSEKYVCTVGVTKHGNPAGWTTTLDGQQTANNVLTYYHRQYLQPTITVGWRDGFGKKQASYSAALLHQMVANLRGIKIPRFR